MGYTLTRRHTYLSTYPSKVCSNSAKPYLPSTLYPQIPYPPNAGNPGLQVQDPESGAGVLAVSGGDKRWHHAQDLRRVLAAGLQPTHPVLPARAGLAAGARRTGAADTLGSAAHLAGRPSLTPTGLGRDLMRACGPVSAADEVLVLRKRENSVFFDIKCRANSEGPVVPRRANAKRGGSIWRGGPSG